MGWRYMKRGGGKVQSLFMLEPKPGQPSRCPALVLVQVAFRLSFSRAPREFGVECGAMPYSRDSGHSLLADPKLAMRTILLLLISRLRQPPITQEDRSRQRGRREPKETWLSRLVAESLSSSSSPSLSSVVRMNHPRWIRQPVFG